MAVELPPGFQLDQQPQGLPDGFTLDMPAVDDSLTPAATPPVAQAPDDALTAAMGSFQEFKGERFGIDDPAQMAEIRSMAGPILNKFGVGGLLATLADLGVAGFEGLGGAALAGASLRGDALQAGAEAVESITGLDITKGAGVEQARRDQKAILETPAGMIATGVGGLPSLTKAAISSGTKQALRGSQQQTAKIVDAAKRAGVPLTTGQAADGGILPMLQAGVRQIPGGRKLNKAAANTSDAIGKFIDDITGKRLSTGQVGRVIEKGLGEEFGFIGRFRKKATKLYNDIAIPGKRPVSAENTVSMFDDITTPIEGAEELSEILSNPKIAALGRAVKKTAGEEGAVPYKVLKDFRTSIGEMLSSSELISDAPKAQLKRIYGAITDDLRTAADQAGKLKEFDRANNFWRGGIDRIDGQISTILKKGDPEKVFKAISGAKDGATQIRTIRKSLKPDEWNVVARSVLKRMGRATPGQQTLEEGVDTLGDAFSPSTFLTNLSKMEKETRDALFSGTNISKNALEDVVVLTDKVRKFERQFGNPSGTSQAAITGSTAGAGTLGAGHLALSGDPSILLGLATIGTGAKVSEVLMTSPKFINWLAKSTKIPTNELPKHISRLSVMAKQNPHLAPSIQEYIAQFGENDGT